MEKLKKYFKENWVALVLYFALGIALPNDMHISRLITIILIVLFIEVNAVIQFRKGK